MTPHDFALYDFLNCCAIAIGQSESGRPARAQTAWLEASIAASGLFPPRTGANTAAGVIYEAAGPRHEGQPGRAALHRALDAASLAVLPAMAGDRQSANGLLRDAHDEAAGTSPRCHGALVVILGEIMAMARTGEAAA